MATWNLEINTYDSIDYEWIKKISKSVPNKSELPNHLEIDDFKIDKILLYLISNNLTFTVQPISKRIVLPPPPPPPPPNQKVITENLQTTVEEHN